MFFAVIQEGHGVYGVGQTKEEAISRCNRLGTPTQISAALVPQDEALHGDILVTECTPALFNHVMACGFDSEFEYTEDGTADIDHGSGLHTIEVQQHAH